MLGNGNIFFFWLPFLILKCLQSTCLCKGVCVLPSILLASSGLTSMFQVHPPLSSCVALADLGKWDIGKFCK